jgi:hypothetical protein
LGAGAWVGGAVAEGAGSALGIGAALAEAEAEAAADETTAEEADEIDAETDAAADEAAEETDAETDDAGSKEQTKAWLGSWASPANVEFSAIQLDRSARLEDHRRLTYNPPGQLPSSPRQSRSAAQTAVSPDRSQYWVEAQSALTAQLPGAERQRQKRMGQTRPIQRQRRTLKRRQRQMRRIRLAQRTMLRAPRKLERRMTARVQRSCTGIVAWDFGGRPRQVHQRGNI